MFADRVHGTYRMVLLLQLLGAAVAFWLSYLLVAGLVVGDRTIEPGKYVVYAVLVVSTIAVSALKQQPTQPAFPQLNMLASQRLALSQTIAVLAVLSLYLVLAKDKSISRAFFILYFPVLWIVLTLGWRYLPIRVARMAFQEKHTVRLMLYGSVEKSLRMEHWLKDRAHFGVQVLGLVSSEAGKNLSWLPHLGRPEDLERLLDEHETNQLLVLDFPEDRTHLQKLVNLTESKAVRLQIVNDLDLLLGRSFVSFQDGGYYFIGLREEPLENPFNRFYKRVLDLLIALPAFVLFLPAAALLVTAIQIAFSRGSLLHRQKRAGLNGRQFTIYKFRTMNEGSHDLARQATLNDERIFPGGAFLRKWSIDELPQLWNVIRGNMSLVGPRAHLPGHDREFAAVYGSYHVRYNVKPGITGLAQVRGLRGEIKTTDDIHQRVAADLEYIETWSPGLDFWILLKTASQLISPPSTAY